MKNPFEDLFNMSQQNIPWFVRTLMDAGVSKEEAEARWKKKQEEENDK